MAGEQDILSLGLDISSFNTEKKAVLKEYISLFNTLSKYEGKIYNPILGDGLTKFNSSVQETNRLLNEMNTRLYSIQLSNNSLVQSLTSSSGSVRGQVNSINSLSTASLNAATSQQKLVINTYAGKSAFEAVGKSLTGVLTNLRYLAYILPGIGIAGIFNLAYESIGNALESLDLFERSLEKTIESQLDYNKGIQEEIQLYKELFNLRQKITEQAEGARITDKDVLSFDQARGYETFKILQEKQKINEIDLQKSTADIIVKGQSPETLKDDLDRRYQIIKGYADRIDKINQEINRKESPTRIGDERESIKGKRGIVGTGRIIEGVLNPNKETLEKIKEVITQKQKNETDSFNFDKGLLDAYIKNQKEYFTLRSELQKFNSDQERKILVENTKNNISTNLKAQQEILSNDRKFLEEKENAIKKQYDDERKSAEINRINTTGVLPKDVTPDRALNPNVGATKADITTAFNKETNDIKQAQIRRDVDLDKVRTEFYQRQQKALTEININEVTTDKEKNKAIFENLQNSLSDRLAAYQKYVDDEQSISNYQYLLDIQKGASKKGGKTSLTQDEQAKVESDAAKRRENILSNSEKEVYNIVHSSLDKILDDVKEANQIEDQIDETNHIKALRRLNEQYENKKISLKKYREKKKEIEYQFEKSDLDQQIANDENSLQRLRETYFEKIKLELEYRKQLLEIAKNSGSEDEKAKAKGAVDAAQNAVDKNINQIGDAEKKLQDDKLKKEKLGPPGKTDGNNKVANEVFRVARRLTDDLRRLYDERIEDEIRFIEKRQQLVDKQYGDEQAAIEKSSLSIKDKAALEIQINAEKQVSDENAVREEINLKIKRFEFDKKIALANGAIGIAAAIIRDGITSPKSIADAVIGAAEIATILATQAPSFAQGVIGFKGGMARFGEDGAEIVKEPGKQARLVRKETISFLPKGTDIIPLTKEFPEFGAKLKDESWEQTKFLAKQIKSSNKEIKNIFKPTIVINGAFESRKNQVLGK